VAKLEGCGHTHLLGSNCVGNATSEKREGKGEARKPLMSSTWILAGFVIVLVGVLIILTGVYAAYQAKEGAEVRGGGVVMIGPIPIAFGTDVGAVKTAMILAITLMVLGIVLMLVMEWIW
jgi:uncharacterized protein (TIGR00304 family)